MKLTKKFFCPVNGWDCPYWDQGACRLVDEGEDPVLECDDAAFFWEPDPDEDYFVWEDENGKRYDRQELLEMGYHFVNGEPVKPEDPPKMGMPGYWEWVKAIRLLWGD